MYQSLIVNLYFYFKIFYSQMKAIKKYRGAVRGILPNLINLKYDFISINHQSSQTIYCQALLKIFFSLSR